jgi:2-haloacid dehalogenase
MSTPEVLVFDVNETLLDIDSLQPLFIRLFAEQRVLREWLSQLVLYSQAVSLAKLYATYGQLGVGSLRMIAETRNEPMEQSDAEELKSRMRDLPAHPEVPASLQRLGEAGFRLVTLTNSAPDPQGNPLERTGLNRYFERMFTVHEIRKFKPAPETYRSVADALGVELAAMCMVAAHTSDTLGAKAIGVPPHWSPDLATRHCPWRACRSLTSWPQILPS